MAARRATMGDIAQQLGISKAAVSYALNGQPGVAADTRQRVLALAEQLGWHPSASARALSGSRTGVVGLILSRPPELLTVETFFMRFLAGVERSLAKRGYSLLLRVTGADVVAETAIYEAWWGERRIDGAILIDERFRDPRMEALARIGLPAVLLGGPVKGATQPMLWTDHAGDAALVVQHLHDLGHRRIAHIGGPREFVHERGRSRGVLNAARRLGMDAVSVPATYTGPETAQVTRRLLDADERPTALVFGSEHMTLEGVAAARELGLQVPDDLSVVSWDDSEVARLVHPSLTALARDTPAFGSLAADVLLDLIGGHDRGRVQVTASQLAARGSTTPPRR
ncbi:LacI family DNA-binding transcriptional regulator [Calidifontibacter terrae]